ncbi:hypothetical protein L1987_22417 [Smallanthus sonchifolius]|uniref:Uncharacterized protein n=1 Tax=Smallanthus sonchifolius TaxID=185202 RepID=A0ACB9IGJ2_9ASTR|nr:hypothetical protein L1987_22417 [Smallanthus sonchifolius]
MDSRESLPPPPLLQRHQTHHHRLPPGMMMPPNSYTSHHLPNSSTATPANNLSIVNHESMQQRFDFDGSDQYGDGSSPPGGFRAGGFNIESARKKRGRPRNWWHPEHRFLAEIPMVGRSAKAFGVGTIPMEGRSAKKERMAFGVRGTIFKGIWGWKDD